MVELVHPSGDSPPRAQLVQILEPTGPHLHAPIQYHRAPPTALLGRCHAADHLVCQVFHRIRSGVEGVIGQGAGRRVVQPLGQEVVSIVVVLRDLLRQATTLREDLEDVI